MTTDTRATVEYLTPTATCGGCRDNIARAFADVDGVDSASLDLATKRTTIVFEPDRVSTAQLVQVLTDAGYAPDVV